MLAQTIYIFRFLATTQTFLSFRYSTTDGASSSNIYIRASQTYYYLRPHTMKFQFTCNIKLKQLVHYHRVRSLIARFEHHQFPYQYRYLRK